MDYFIAVIKRNLGALSEGLPFCLWLGLGEGIGTTKHHMRIPLFDTSRMPKPGYRAYRLLAAILEDVERIERRGPGYEQYWLYRKGRTPLLVVWKTVGGGPARAALPPGVTKGHVLRVTNAIRGTYVIEAFRGSEPLTLGSLPLIAGDKLPAAVYPSP